MNIGVSTASFYPLETEAALEELGKAGVKYTEIFFNALSELKPAFIDILELRAPLLRGGGAIPPLLRNCGALRCKIYYYARRQA